MSFLQKNNYTGEKPFDIVWLVTSWKRMKRELHLKSMAGAETFWRFAGRHILILRSSPKINSNRSNKPQNLSSCPKKDILPSDNLQLSESSNKVLESTEQPMQSEGQIWKLMKSYLKRSLLGFSLLLAGLLSSMNALSTLDKRSERNIISLCLISLRAF